MYSPGEKIIRFMKGPNFKNMILNIGKGMNIPRNSYMVPHINRKQCRAWKLHPFKSNTNHIILYVFHIWVYHNTCRAIRGKLQWMANRLRKTHSTGSILFWFFSYYRLFYCPHSHIWPFFTVHIWLK